MQDRFKFRAWFKPEYREPIMLYQVEQTYDFMRGEPENVPEDCFGDVLADKDYIVMQCTGQKDKNGKLIYEGDIVRFKDNITINGSKTHISVVEHNEAFNSFMYHAECIGLYTVNKAQNEQYDVEVIGNIYENPELLEVQNADNE